jgi:pimeloyl-ACP methyl ester carboxylesterase
MPIRQEEARMMKTIFKTALVVALTAIAVLFVDNGAGARGLNLEDNNPSSPGPDAQENEHASGKYAEVNGLKVYYEIHGSGRPLLLLHGAFGNTEGWASILPALTKTHQVIAIELEGHGHTRDLDRPLTYEQMAEDTAQLLKQLKVEHVDMFGYSMGGTVAFGIAIRHPELVRKLVTLGSNVGKLKDAFEPQNYKLFQGLSADFAPPQLKKPYDRMAPDPTRWPTLVKKIKDLDNNFAGYSETEVRSIKAAALIIQGDHDGVRPEHAVEIYRLIPNSQLAIIPGADHFILFTHPEKVLSLLVPFLDAPSAGDGTTGE